MIFIAVVAILSWKIYWIWKLDTCCVLLLRTGNDAGSIEMMPTRLPLFDAQRQQMRGDQLWRQEVQRARLFDMKHIHCLCTKCMDQKKLLLRTVRKHLM